MLPLDSILFSSVVTHLGSRHISDAKPRKRGFPLTSFPGQQRCGKDQKGHPRVNQIVETVMAPPDKVLHVKARTSVFGESFEELGVRYWIHHIAPFGLQNPTAFSSHCLFLLPMSSSPPRGLILCTTGYNSPQHGSVSRFPLMGCSVLVHCGEPSLSSWSLMAASILRLRKLCYVQPVRFSALCFRSFETNKDEGAETPKFGNEVKEKQRIKNKNKRQPREWRCIHNCCWIIGSMCTTWWLLLFLYNTLPTALTGFQVPESPGTRLRREGVSPLHPVVMVPGIVTGGLELWEGRPCAEGLFRKRLWGGSFSEIFKRPMCLLEHLSLDNETGLDPPGIRVRAVRGLAAADHFAPGYFVWAVLIKNLAKIGYEGKNMHMAAYDWRLSFQNTEIRDQALSRLKSKIELMYAINGHKKVVVVPHSMGAIYFLHFMKWVESPPPMGGGGGPSWCATHIKAIMNIGPAFLGVPKAVSNIFSAEGKDVAYIRAMAPVVLDSEILGLQTFEHVMRLSRSWDSLISLLPKGGETIWGNLDWSPEDGHSCDLTKKKYLHSTAGDTNYNNSNKNIIFQVKEPMKYGRIISFGKESSELPSSELPGHDIKELLYRDSPTNFNSSCGEVWTEYDEVSRESIRKIAENKAYTVQTLFDLLRFVAPKMMQRAEAHFSHGIADNLDNPKYDHYKYWSNPLETKLPVAPDLEIYCLYGVGLPTERSYIYKTSPSDKCKNIPFRIDSSADGETGSCLKNGAHFVDGDDTVPVLSAGYMCTKGWRGRTRFNPSGVATYIREYRHKRPGSFIERRGTESGSHVDIMGNVALIEDILRIAAGATGTQIGGDRIYSDIMRMSERINLQL